MDWSAPAYTQLHSADKGSLTMQGRCGGGGATVTVTVTDTCPECAAPTDGQGDHFDLNALSFNQIAPMLNGRIDVNYRLVACTPPSALQVQVDGNDGPGLWLRLLITVSCPLLTCLFEPFLTCLQSLTRGAQDLLKLCPALLSAPSRYLTSCPLCRCQHALQPCSCAPAIDHGTFSSCPLRLAVLLLPLLLCLRCTSNLYYPDLLMASGG